MTERQRLRTSATPHVFTFKCKSIRTDFAEIGSRSPEGASICDDRFINGAKIRIILAFAVGHGG
jgi:hypothetical protein